MNREQMDEFIARMEAAFLKSFRKLNSELTVEYETHVPPGQFLVLRTLAATQRATVSELAEKLLVKPSAVTAIIDRMIKNNWVTRQRTDEDRRVVYVQITESGLEVLRQVEAIRRNIIEKYVSQLGEEDLCHLLRIYEKLATIIDQTNQQ